MTVAPVDDLLRAIGRIFPQGGIARKLLTVVSGVAAGHLLTMLATPLLSRLFSPGDYGVLGVYMAILGVVAAISTLSYEQAIPIVADDKDARSLLVVALLAVLLVASLSLCSIVIIRLTKPSLMGSLGSAAWFLPLGIMGLGFHQALTVWGLRLQAYKLTARAKFAQSSGTVLLQSLAGWLGGGALGLVGGDACGRFAGAGSLLPLGGVQTDILNAFRDTRRHWRTAIAFRRFPFLSVGDRLLDSVGMNGVVLIVAVLYGPWQTGLFAFAQRLIGLPAALLGQVAGQVYVGEVSRSLRESPESFRPMFRVAIRKLALASAPVGLVLLIVPPFVMGTLFGERWRDTGTLISLMSPLVWAQLVASPVSQSLQLRGRLDLQLGWNVGRFVAVCLTLVAAHRLGVSFRGLIVAYTVVMVTAYVILLILIDRAEPGELLRKHDPI